MSNKAIPSAGERLRGAKLSPPAKGCCMYTACNGFIHCTAKARVRHGDGAAPDVRGMLFSYNADKVRAAIAETLKMAGIG